MVQTFEAGRALENTLFRIKRSQFYRPVNQVKHKYVWKIIEKFECTMESIIHSREFQVILSLAIGEGLAVNSATAVAFAGRNMQSQKDEAAYAL